MIPRIDLSQWTDDTVPKREVEKMTEALSEAFAMLLREKEKEYRFAKLVSYISLAIAIVLVFKEVF